MTFVIRSATSWFRIATGSSIVWNPIQRRDGVFMFSSAMRMLALLDGIVGKRCEPGDPVDFDHEEFIIERLRELEWFE